MNGKSCTHYCANDGVNDHCDNCELRHVVSERAKTDPFYAEIARSSGLEECYTCRAFANFAWYILYGYNGRYGDQESTDPKDAVIGDYVRYHASHYGIFLGWVDGVVGGEMYLFESNGHGTNFTNVQQVEYKGIHDYYRTDPKTCCTFVHAHNYKEKNAEYKQQMHTHSYNADGICTACGAYDFSADSASRGSLRSVAPAVYAAVKSGVPVRCGPHAECTALLTLSAGEEIVVSAYLTNSAGNRWYVLRDGGYIYSENVKRLRSAVSLDDLKVSETDDGDVKLFTTVRKLEKMRASDFGVRLVELSAWDNAHKRSELGELGIATFGATVQKTLPDPNGDATLNWQSYTIDVALRGEMGLTLIPGEGYAAQLTATVGGVQYESNIVTFIAGVLSGGYTSIDVGGGQTGPNTVDVPAGDLWLRADKTQVRAAEDVTFTFGPAGAVNFIVTADRVGGGNYCRHGVGGGTVHTIRFEEAGQYDVRVEAEISGVMRYSNTVRITVAAVQSENSAPRVEMMPSLVWAGETDAEFEVRVSYWNLQEPSAFGVQLTDTEGHQLCSCYTPVTPDEPGCVYNYGSLYESRRAQADMEYPLDPDTPYRFRIWADFPGVRGTYYSEYVDFRTAAAAPVQNERKATPVPVRFDANWNGEVTELYAVKERAWGWFTNAEGTSLFIRNFPDVERKGYEFLGWYDAPEGGSRVLPDDPFPGTPVTLYAHWREKQKDPPLRVTFDLNDGTGNVIVRWVLPSGWWGEFVDAEGNPTDETMPEPTRQGYVFLGWNMKPDGNGLSIGPHRLIASHEPITVYANWAAEKQKTNPFTDVAGDSWYCDWVSRAYASGLINGKTATTFAPDSELTMAEALKLAACIHQKLNSGAVTLKNSASGHWCDSYYAYLKEHDLLCASKIDYRDYGKAVTRAEMVRIFFDVMNADQRRQINEIPGGSIPDVDLLDSAQTWFAYYVYAFYQAGILNGSDDYGTFHPYDTIRRSAVAAIIVRVIDPTLRVGPPALLGKKR